MGKAGREHHLLATLGPALRSCCLGAVRPRAGSWGLDSRDRLPACMPEPGCLWGQAPLLPAQPLQPPHCPDHSSWKSPGWPGSQGSWSAGRRERQGPTAQCRYECLPGAEPGQGRIPAPQPHTNCGRAHLVLEQYTQTPRVCIGSGCFRGLEPTRCPAAWGTRASEARATAPRPGSRPLGSSPLPQRGKSKRRPHRNLPGAAATASGW